MGTKIEIGYFGKLPNFKDFIKFNSGFDEIINFDEWIQKGMLYLRKGNNGDWKKNYEQSSNYNFIFPSNNGEYFLIGIIKPSFDSSRRAYPYIIFLRIDNTLIYQNTIYLLPIIFSHIDENLHQLINEIDQLNDVQSINHKILKIDLNKLNISSKDIEEYNDYLRKTTVNDFWTALYSCFEDTSKYKLLYNLLEIIAPNSNSDPESLSLGLSFPLKNGPNNLKHAICFWIHLTSMLARVKSNRLFLFWQTSLATKDFFLYLFFREPPSSFFLKLVCPEKTLDLICTLDKEGRDSMIMNSISDKHKSLLEDKNLTLLNFLNNLT